MITYVDALTVGTVAMSPLGSVHDLTNCLDRRNLQNRSRSCSLGLSTPSGHIQTSSKLFGLLADLTNLPVQMVTKVSLLLLPELLCL